MTIKAERIDHGNDDLSVVNAARVSFDKASEWLYPSGDGWLRQSEHAARAYGWDGSTRKLNGKDERLIGYLARNNHWTPFGHQRFTYDIEVYTDELLGLVEWTTTVGAAGFVLERITQVGQDLHLVRVTDSLWGWTRGGCPLSLVHDIHSDLLIRCPVAAKELLSDSQLFTASASTRELEARSYADDLGPRHQFATLRITAPIFVFRQLMRSNVGIVYNEVSRRYVDDEPTFWRPEKWRKRPDKSIKQGSSDETIFWYPDELYVEGRDVPYQGREYDRVGDDATEAALREYKQMLGEGIAPEMARTVLPQSMISSLWMTANYDAWRRVIGLRVHEHAQKEIRDLAYEIAEQMPEDFVR